jgi:hypothetical protein
MDVPATLTPDQRLRVFVSSTLTELGAERAAARRSSRVVLPKTGHGRAKGRPLSWQPQRRTGSASSLNQQQTWPKRTVP